MPKYEHLIRELGKTIIHRAQAYGFLNESEAQLALGDLMEPNTDDSDVLESRLSGLVRRLNAKSKKRLLLVIDNLDFVYHQFDRSAFAREWTGEARDAHTTIGELVHLFTGAGGMARTGMIALIAMRNDTLDQFKAKWGWVPYDDGIIDTKAYRIAEVASFDDVVESHIGLLESITSRLSLEGRKKQFTGAVEFLRKSLVQFGAKHEDTLNTIESLSRQGLRHVVSLFGRYLWLGVSYQQEEDAFYVNRRFVDSPAPILLLTITDGKRLFSQFSSRFPNIYLVRTDYYRDQEYAMPAELRVDNAHTYWLKRLLLQVIHEKQQKHEACDTKELIHIFAAQPTKGWYEESTVRLTLGSMAQSNTSNLIEYSLTSSATSQVDHIKHIKLTKRGLCMVMGEMDSFTYLEHVIDDHILPIPAALSEHFEFMSFDYGYLVERDRNEYREKKVEMFNEKYRRVMVFLEILKVGLELEKQLYDRAFERVLKVIRALPNVDEMQESVDIVVRRSAKWMKGNERQVGERLRGLLPDMVRVASRARDDLKQVYIYQDNDSPREK